VRAVVVALLVLLSGCSVLGSMQPPAAPAPELPQNVAVVTALKHTKFFAEAGCTAVDIGYGRVVTAKHCVEDDDPERNWDVGDVTNLGVVVYKSPELDFAILVNQEWIKNPPASLRAPRLGEHVYTVGYPMQLATDKQELTVTDGVAAGPFDDEGNIRITAPIYFGNSGGGCWAEDGSLLGITVSGFVEMPGMNFMVSAEDVAEVL
jgi:S1-C subfamily serine protease